MSRRKGDLHRNGTPLKVLDILETDGGWLTQDGMMTRLPGVNPETLNRSLWRLLERGYVEYRDVALAMSGSRVGASTDKAIGTLEVRKEWTLTREGLRKCLGETDDD